MATSRKTQAKAGVPEKRRGQQMGDERSKPSKVDEAQRETPALSGRRKTASKFYADDSAQRRGTSGKSTRARSPRRRQRAKAGSKISTSPGGTRPPPARGHRTAREPYLNRPSI